MQHYTCRTWLKQTDGQALRYRAKDALYHLRRRLWRPFNVVRVPTLPPTWRDADTRLLHAAFAILVNVVEEEEWFEHWAFAPEDHGACGGEPACIHCDEMAHYWPQRMDECAEVGFLYDWWKNVRPVRVDPDDWLHDRCLVEGIPTGFDWESTDSPDISTMIFRGTPAQQARRVELTLESADMEEAHEEMDTAMLVRLMQIRRTLWT